MQGKFLFSVDDRMAGVIAALIANDAVEISGNKIGDLALALVAPLVRRPTPRSACSSFHLTISC